MENISEHKISLRFLSFADIFFMADSWTFLSLLDAVANSLSSWAALSCDRIHRHFSSVHKIEGSADFAPLTRFGMAPSALFADLASSQRMRDCIVLKSALPYSRLRFSLFRLYCSFAFSGYLSRHLFVRW